MIGGLLLRRGFIDVSYAAAQMLGMWEKGTAPVKVEVLSLAIEPVQRFTLQVGSFADETNAQKLAEQLRKSFENVYVATSGNTDTEISSGESGPIRNQRSSLGHCRKTFSNGLQGSGNQQVKISSDWMH